MIRVDIESILMSPNIMPSVIVLRERPGELAKGAPCRRLSIQTGSFEAAAISQGVDLGRAARPITHDLLLDCVAALDAKIERVEINRVDAPQFYASVVLRRNAEDEIFIDARPSDAIALAVRSNAPMFVEDDVMNRLGQISKHEEDEKQLEIEKFDEFVHTLSPDDF